MSSTSAAASRPAQFRLPVWAADFLDTMSETRGTSKTDIVVQAIDCLRSQELEHLMEEGYQEMSSLNRTLAEDNVRAMDADGWPEW